MVSPIIVAYTLHVPSIILSPHQITPLGTSDPSEEKATCVSEPRVGCRRFHRLLSELARVVGNPLRRRANLSAPITHTSRSRPRKAYSRHHGHSQIIHGDSICGSCPERPREARPLTLRSVYLPTPCAMPSRGMRKGKTSTSEMSGWAAGGDEAGADGGRR